MDAEWFFFLSAGARLAWIYLKAHVKAEPMSQKQPNKAHRLEPNVAAHRWNLPLPDVEAMEAAALSSGGLSIEGKVWVVADKLAFQTSRTKERFVGQTADLSDKHAFEVRLSDKSPSPLDGPPSPQHSPPPPIIPPNPDISSAKRFSKPSLADVEQYMATISLPASEAAKFWDFHESKGWVIGKNSMKDWRAACRTWGHNYRPLNGQTRKIGLTEAEKELMNR